MENPPLLYGKDINTGSITQIKSIGNVLLTTNVPISGCINGYISGTFPTVVPANATTGNLFTVPVAGNYVLNISASGINTSVAMINMQIWINGVNTLFVLKAWANEINSHKTLVPISFRYALNKGNNYLYLRMISGTSDGNDFASFNWVYSPIIV